MMAQGKRNGCSGFVRAASCGAIILEHIAARARIRRIDAAFDYGQEKQSGDGIR